MGVCGRPSLYLIPYSGSVSNGVGYLVRRKRGGTGRGSEPHPFVTKRSVPDTRDWYRNCIHQTQGNSPLE